MYRLLKIRNISLQNTYKTFNKEYSQNICGFCNFYHQFTPRSLKIVERLQVRHCSSSTSNSIMHVSKGKLKHKKKSKKYAELMEVTSSKTNSTKVSVKNLTEKHVSRLIDQPEVSLDKLHKIDDNFFIDENSENKLISNVDTCEDSVDDDFLDSIDKRLNLRTFSDNTYSVYESSLIDIFKKLDSDYSEPDKSDSIEKSQIINKKNNKIQKNSSSLDKSEKKGLSEKNSSKFSDKKSVLKNSQTKKDKLKYFNEIMFIYTNVCKNCNDESLINNFLKVYKKWKSSKALYVNDINVFNNIIEALCSKLDLKNIFKIFKYLKTRKIHANHQTYALIFTCIGRMKLHNKDAIDLLNLIKLEMKHDSISFNDVVTKSIFTRDQKSVVESIIKLIDDKFESVYEKPDISYDCRLLENLANEKSIPSSPIDGLLTLNDYKVLLERQMKIENDGEVKIQSIANQAESIETTFYTNKLLKLEKIWEVQAMKAFKRNLSSLKNIESMKSINTMRLYPFLSILNPEDYISILMRKVKRLALGSEMHSVPYNVLCIQIGKQIFKLYETKIKQEYGVTNKIIDVYLQYCDWLMKRNDELNCREKWMLLQHETSRHGESINFEVPQWHLNICLSVGVFMYNIIMNDLKIDANYVKNVKSSNYMTPAFFKVFRHKNLLVKEEVKPHPVVSKLYRDSNPLYLTFDTTLIPLLCPPRPWVSANTGGYIVTKVDLVRMFQQSSLQLQKIEHSNPKILYPTLDSLNQLGSIPWTINTKILDLLIKVFRKNGSVELNVPQPPSVLVHEYTLCNAIKNKKEAHKVKANLNVRRAELYSLWCETLYRLSLANHFRNKMFWLPHNLDFRGRVYPIPPHLHHLGSDLARSLLLFALKKPLGPNGLEYLKLHVINLTGFKKRESNENRLKFCDEIMDKIIDSAENPLTGEKWWVTSENPWQTLAGCIEIAKALKMPDPENYISGFPIHQDGSCNGLQHYAALGRDQIGAENVNLYPNEAPQDVYSNVVTMVENKRKLDADKGNELAKALEGFISRKVIKRTVMTTVYGVTWYGAKLQIHRELEDIKGYPQEVLKSGSSYVAHLTFQSLRTMFKSAREIQDWFIESCILICSTLQKSMEWITPLGLPVIQPYYHQQRNKAILSNKPNVMKQKNAFPPNFIHSLDSSHMMLTSINCERQGITFVSVHDCFWTHPCSVKDMNKICREQFVLLHSEPILEDLSKFLTENFKENIIALDPKFLSKNDKTINKLTSVLTRVPKQGDFDLKKVLSSTYFFN